MKSRFRAVTLVLVTLLSVFATYWAINNQLRIVHILSDSMSPQIKRGDLVLIRSIPTESLKVGDVAILPALKERGVYYAHRVIELSRNSIGEVVVRTKGDANPVPDDWKLAITSNKTPIYLWDLPLSRFLK